MKKIAPILLFVFICMTAYAQTEVVIQGPNGEALFTFLANVPDLQIRQLPREIASRRQTDPVEFIRLLAEYINEISTCDFDRVKKIHDWVALNIRYDTQSYFSGRHTSQTFNDVIRRGDAVCAGYSDVFKYICDVAGIESIIVSGYARGASSNLFRFEDVTNSNHAWNIVIINGKRYLVDTTWNAGYISGRTFHARYRTNYFLTNPAVFIYEHLPTESAYQLLDPPLSAEEFNNLPFLEPLFFESFKTWTALARITEVNNREEHSFEFSLNEGYEFCYVWLNQSGTKMGRDIFPAKSDVYTITIPATLRPGRYSLRVSVRKQGDQLYWSCGEFGFNIK